MIFICSMYEFHEASGFCCMSHLYDYMWNIEHHDGDGGIAFDQKCYDHRSKEREESKIQHRHYLQRLERENESDLEIHRQKGKRRAAVLKRVSKRRKQSTINPMVNTDIRTIKQLIESHRLRQGTLMMVKKVTSLKSN
jgi:hypothetical protein